MKYDGYVAYQGPRCCVLTMMENDAHVADDCVDHNGR